MNPDELNAIIDILTDLTSLRTHTMDDFNFTLGSILLKQGAVHIGTIEFDEGSGTYVFNPS